MNKQRWYFAGLVYFCVLFAIIPSIASAYIDPSITSYAIQAIAGIVIASGAFFAAYGRRAKKAWMRAVGIEETEIRVREKEAEIYDEDLREELEVRKAMALRQQKPTDGKSGHILRKVLLSLLCGFSLAITIVLRPIISFYISNEGEFWFSLRSIIGFVLLIFFLLATLTAAIHFFLPDRHRPNYRLLFAALVAAVTLCAFIQNHFMSSYLPVLTGDPIDWSMYQRWGATSIALWGGVTVLFFTMALARPRIARAGIYLVMVFLLVTEAIAGTVDLVSSKHENKKIESYFSSNGLFETSTAGNVVALISDTFEGTYMNQILEKYPEYRDMLSDCTYYDNVTGTSVFTYFSYAKLLTGIDFPNGANSEQGISYCFDHQTTVDRILKNNWDVEYYTTFSPTPNMMHKILNYSDDRLEPDIRTAWDISKHLFRSTLFQSLPQFLKPFFLVYTSQYELYKSLIPAAASPYVEDDAFLYNYINDHGLFPVDGKPRYSIVQLWGLHNPCCLNENFETVEYDEGVPGDYRREQAARASLKLLRTYLDRLKESGTYDQTTVIMTADHGFNLRYYPTLIVKEAGRKDDGFRIDHTQLSMQEDFENIIAALTSGIEFNEVVSRLDIPENRIRYALDYRSVGGYATKTYRRSIVRITGDACLEDSYQIQKDEFFMNDEFPGRCVLNVPFIADSLYNDTVSVYGIAEGDVHGHSVLFDAFFDTEEERTLELKMIVKNITDQPQNINILIDGKTVTSETIPVSTDSVQISSLLPEKTASRWTVELNLPDAQHRYVDGEELQWNAYDSIIITEAGFYEQ